MLSFFPSRDLDEPVSKEHLRAEMAELRAEMHQGFRRMTVAIYGSMVATAGVVVTAATLIG